jgi:hypothetical protein
MVLWRLLFLPLHLLSRDIVCESFTVIACRPAVS